MTEGALSIPGQLTKEQHEQIKHSNPWEELHALIPTIERSQKDPDKFWAETKTQTI